MEAYVQKGKKNIFEKILFKIEFYLWCCDCHTEGKFVNSETDHVVLSTNDCCSGGHYAERLVCGLIIYGYRSDLEFAFNIF